MFVGQYAGVLFLTSSVYALSPENIKGSAGSDWAAHDVVNGKAKSEYIGPKLKSYTFDIVLHMRLGVSPRVALTALQKLAEDGTVDYFIIGGIPVGLCRFKLTDVSDEWNSVYRAGALESCKVSLTLEEYA